MKNKGPSDKKIERTKEIIEKVNIKNGEELTQLYLKSDVLLLACVFEKFIKVSVNEFGINLLYFVRLPGFIRQCGSKYTRMNLQTLLHKDMILLLENNIRGGISSVMGDRYVKSDENKQILNADAKSLYGHSMYQPLPYDEIEFDRNVKLEDVLNTPDNSDFGYFVEVDLRHPYNIKKRRIFQFVQRIRKLIMMNIIII